MKQNKNNGIDICMYWRPPSTHANCTSCIILYILYIVNKKKENDFLFPVYMYNVANNIEKADGAGWLLDNKSCQERERERERKYWVVNRNQSQSTAAQGSLRLRRGKLDLIKSYTFTGYMLYTHLSIWLSIDILTVFRDVDDDWCRIHQFNMVSKV